jgi:hypothetical protein
LIATLEIGHRKSSTNEQLMSPISMGHAAMPLFEDRVEHAVKYLHRHRSDTTKNFTAFYNNHDCDLLV